MPMLLIIEPKAFSRTERGRIGSNVDNHVVNRPAGTPDELRFASPGSPMETAHDPQPRARLGILNERGGVDAMPGRDICVEGSGEETALVGMRSRHEDQDANKSGRLNLHRAMVPARDRVEA